MLLFHEVSDFSPILRSQELANRKIAKISLRTRYWYLVLPGELAGRQIYCTAEYLKHTKAVLQHLIQFRLFPFVVDTVNLIVLNFKIT